MNNQEETPTPVELSTPMEPQIPSESDFDLLQSITRLIIGGVYEGWDQLTSRLKAWEEEAGSKEESLPAERRIIIIENDSALTESYQPPPAESDQKMVRLALVGLLFRAESRMARRRKRAIAAANHTTTALVKPLANWASKRKRFQPAANRFEALVRKGESISRGWIDRGRIEEARSRQLVRTAAQDSFSDTMDELGQAPALQDLVRKQSAGLTQEALNEARVRTVGGDYVLEHYIRSLLRRVPRSQIPPPDEQDIGPSQNEESGG